MPPILPPRGGFLFLDKEKFAASFAADVAPDMAAFIGLPVALGCGCPDGRSEPAGVEGEAERVCRRDRRSHDSATGQRMMATRAGSRVTEVFGSHAVYVSQPAAIAAAIDLAAQAASR